MDLTTLDKTQPPDTQAVAQGATRIRETRDAILTSFGIEHALNGAHKFLFGNTGARPAGGNGGRIFFNTQHGSVEIDGGGAWTMVHTANPAVAFAGPPVSLTNTFAVMQSVIVSSSTYAQYLALGYLQAQTVPAAGQIINIEARLLVDGVVMANSPNPYRFLFAAAVGQAVIEELPILILGMDNIGVNLEGTHTITLQARNNSTTTDLVNVANRTLAVLSV